ncbi:hypothetical protein B0G76_5867 [Paraburkholderia sp. BL23I1N1]|nr:hypothetical protein [Paraburkholderia sp. BL23I1N1]RKE39430.1 hypothetical protein B0G76_5848 [Paraburkholderia sp. BL23I1N1]RKE39446.1 hypothetical protein B0G76_5867 [Paraburkholderia sp. BL23I1N1]
MKVIVAFGAIGVIALAVWLPAEALDQSNNITVPATLTAVRDLVER